MKIETAELKQWASFAATVLFLVLGIIGFILPIIPGYGFFAISVILFTRSSSDRVLRVLTRIFGSKMIASVRKPIPLKVKILSVVSILLANLWSIFSFIPAHIASPAYCLFLQIVMGATAILTLFFILWPKKQLS
ncbi:MAG: DUF454 family protein [Patescibacteria group bacterium]